MASGLRGLVKTGSALEEGLQGLYKSYKLHRSGVLHRLCASFQYLVAKSERSFRSSYHEDLTFFSFSIGFRAYSPPLKQIEYGVYGDLIILYPRPYSIHLRGTVGFGVRYGKKKKVIQT